MIAIIQTDQIIVVRGSGLFVASELSDHFVEMRDLVDKKRRAHQDVRVLVDLTASTTQQSDIANSIWDAVMSLYDSCSDRVAVVVNSTLFKIQLRRLQTEPRYGIFDAKADAMHFLTKAPANASASI